MIHTLAYVVKFWTCSKIFDDLGVLRRTKRTTTYTNVLLTYTKLTHNLFDVRQRIRKIFHTLAYAG